MAEPESVQNLSDAIRELEKVSSKTNLENLVNIITKILGYDYLVDGTEVNHLLWCLNRSPDEKRALLGQVNTPEYVAKLIVRLCIRTGHERILDPCFGLGIFLTSAIDRLQEIQRESGAVFPGLIGQVFGIDLDPYMFLSGLISALAHANTHNAQPTFFNGDFFGYRENFGSFDVALMNPPYVRQEDLNKDMPFLDKKAIKEKVLKGEGKQVEVPKRSNLYAYFFIHLSKFLKEGGLLGAITSNTWLDTSFGRDLQRFLLDKFDIDFVIDFDRDAFPNAAVGSCIVILRKNASHLNSGEHKTRFVLVKERLPLKEMYESIVKKGVGIRVRQIGRENLLADSKWGKYLYAPDIYFDLTTSPLLVPLRELADVSRGVTTNYNKFFVLNEDTIRRFKIEPEHFRYVICSPKDADFFDTKNRPRLLPLLFVTKTKKDLVESGHRGVLRYIEEWEKKLPNTRGAPSLKAAFEKDRDTWFMLKPPDVAPLIFSYIIREDKNFILNSEKYLVRENFYNITPHNSGDLMVLFGVMNSTIPKVLLEFAGRTHGRGLLKIQAYELLELQVPNIAKMSNTERDRITCMAEELASARIDDYKGREGIIRNIDEAVVDFLGTNMKVGDLESIHHQLLSARLLRKNAMPVSG